jgi:hypothetical protein
VITGACSATSSSMCQVAFPLCPFGAAYGDRVVGQGLVVAFNIFHLKVGVSLETLVGVELDHFGKGEFAFEEFVCTISVYRIVCFLGDRVEEPTIDFVFFCRGFRRIVVCHLSSEVPVFPM